MHITNEIEFLIKHPEGWRVLFLSAGLLGIYLSLIINVFLRIRRHQSIFLGFYTAALSLLLLKLSTFVTPIEQISNLLDSAGVAALYLIGPLSFYLFSVSTQSKTSYRLYIQFLPAILAAVLIQLELPSIFHWIYMIGMLHMGTYLLIQSWIIFRKERIHYWNSRYTGLQLALYITTSLALATPAWLQDCLIASMSLTILILTIWIRLMHTAIIHYINKPDN